MPLVLAARGIERLIANGGKMRLIVGCTLDVDEIEAIERGYDLREQVEKKLASDRPDASRPTRHRHGLEALAWMVANEFLDIKVAVPDQRRRASPSAFGGIYHEKVGIITDREGNRLSFSGSINETWAGWINNRESFHVHLSWEGGRDFKHVQDEVEPSRSSGRQGLERPGPRLSRGRQGAASWSFCPRTTGSCSAACEARPRSWKKSRTEAASGTCTRLLPDETRRVVWTYIRNAARPGERSAGRRGHIDGHPWPHQVQTYQRLLESWPCQMLIADEVGLGKTITAGLFIRQAWLSGAGADES